MVGRDREVAQHLENVPAADAGAVYRGNDRLGDVTDEPVQRLDLEDAALGWAVVAGLLALLLVAAGTERSVPCPRQRHDADLPINPGHLERADQLVYGAAPKSVVSLGPVDRDPGHAAVSFVENVSHTESKRRACTRVGSATTPPRAGGSQGALRRSW